MASLFRLRYDSRWGEELFLTGNIPELGNWNPNKAVPMEYVGPGIWSAMVETVCTPSLQTMEYKYFIRENGQIHWEDGPNRLLPEGKDRVWDWFGLTERQTMRGVAVPLFSLRTENDFGIGEFADLPKLGDWCLANGLKIIQILPINDTTLHYDWRDSYPYNAISAFALNPIYLNLKQLGIKEDTAFKRARTILNKEESVNYPKVLKAKWKHFQTAFEQQWEALKGTAEFQQFVKENEDWLHDYAQYCAERDNNGTEIHLFLQYHCDKQLREAVKALHDKGLLLKGDIPIGVNPSGVDVKSHPDLFNLDVQVGAPPDDFAYEGQNWGFPSYNWEAMAKDNYAWWQRRLQVMARYFDAYRIDHILGFFRIWEIPKSTRSGLLGHFNPSLPLSVEEIEKQGFKFSKRFHTTRGVETLFIPDPIEKDKYIPRIELQRTYHYQHLKDDQKQALDRIYEDFYYHRHNEFWKQKALEKLPPLINATKMIACGEDLGMIPASVPEVMQQLGIMSLEVQRMPKVFGHQFVHTEDLPENCVYTTGTHDMPTLRGWLDEDRVRTRQFFDSLDLDDRKITGKTIKKILEKHCDSPSKWNIYPLQDLLDREQKNWSPNPKEDQINVPANARNQWKWRMRMNLETLLPPIR
ncbi:MAG: 4-alpha-glucanotransferase [Bacteroidales bacterium]|nr:4-alpha-glucanotransferase [Bacteroidales bacterium]